MFSEACWVVRKSTGLAWPVLCSAGAWRGTTGVQHQSMDSALGQGQNGYNLQLSPTLPLSFPVHSSHARGDVQPDPRVLSRVSDFT